MKVLLYMLSLSILASPCLSETIIPGGNVSGTWDIAGSPYIIQGNCVITSVSTLTIESGVVVLMEPFNRLRCEGRLLAIGTVTDSIIFTASDTVQGCEGLDFLNLNQNPLDSSRLEYCRISYGVGSPYPDTYMHGGGLFIKNSSKIRLDHCFITRNRTQYVLGAAGVAGGTSQPGQAGEFVTAGHGGGIYCENSSPLIINSVISYNQTGDAYGGIGGNGGDDYGSSSNVYGGDGGAGGYGFGGEGGGIYFSASNAILQNNIRFFAESCG